MWPWCAYTLAWYSLYMLQLVTAEIQPRFTAQVNSAVSLDRTRMVNITSPQHFFCTWYMTKHISHTCGRRSCRPARYLSSSTHSHIFERCLATVLRVSSSITTGHYVLNKDVDHKRLGSENNNMKGAQQARTKWHRWYRCSSTYCSSKLYIFHEMRILRLSEIRPIPWSLTEG